MSAGASADADLALAEGRLVDAERLLMEGIATDRQRHTAGPAETKLVMLAELKLRRGDKAGARAAAAQVTELPARRFEAALVQLAIGDDKAAKATAASLGNEVAPRRRAMAKMIEAEELRTHGKPVQAIVELQEAMHIEDHPFVHFLIGRAALDAKRYADAYSELQTSFARRGELALAPEELPSVRRVPPVLFYLAKAQEGLGSPDAPKSYRAFLAMMHDPDPNDPLVVAATAHATP